MTEVPEFAKLLFEAGPVAGTFYAGLALLATAAWHYCSRNPVLKPRAAQGFIVGGALLMLTSLGIFLFSYLRPSIEISKPKKRVYATFHPARVTMADGHLQIAAKVSFSESQEKKFSGNDGNPCRDGDRATVFALNYKTPNPEAKSANRENILHYFKLAQLALVHGKKLSIGVRHPVKVCEGENDVWYQIDSLVLID